MRALVFILSVGFGSVGFSQGLMDGYFKGKGKLDIAASAFYQTSDTYIAGTSTEIALERDIFSIGAFAEYGITSKWDVIANVPLITSLSMIDGKLELQDAAIATKYELVKTQIGGRDLSIIPAVSLSFPLSNYVTESAQAIGQRATIISPRLILQYNLPAGLFIQVQGGYNYALSPVTSSVPLSAKVGGSYGKFYFDVWFDYQKGQGNKDFLGTVPFNSFREFVVDYNRIGGVFYYGFHEKVGAFVNYSYIISGRNTAPALGVGAGFVLKLKVN